MEENKRKGPGMFYAVVGVATLVVAIAGATFAYFSASTPVNSGTITGETNNINGNTLSLSVSRVTYTDTGAASDSLVPAVITDSTTNGINAALQAKCVNAGYTGCHVYKIDISSTETISEANLLLDLNVTPVENGSAPNWKYLVFTGATDAAEANVHNATSITTSATTIKTTGITANNFTDDVDLHSRGGVAAGLTAGTHVYYYLMVYLANIDAAQNAPTPGAGETYEFGTYAGQVVLQAMGGQVKATFGTAPTQG